MSNNVYPKNTRSKDQDSNFTIEKAEEMSIRQLESVSGGSIGNLGGLCAQNIQQARDAKKINDNSLSALNSKAHLYHAEPITAKSEKTNPNVYIPRPAAISSNKHIPFPFG